MWRDVTPRRVARRAPGDLVAAADGTAGDERTRTGHITRGSRFVVSTRQRRQRRPAHDGGRDLLHTLCDPGIRPADRVADTAPVVSGKIATITMNEEPTPANGVLADLYRLIEALDRRMPQLQRSGEAQIARDAADLRQRARQLIRQIEAGTPVG